MQERSWLPLDVERLHKLLPGLSLRVNNITTTYALITCHSVIPGSVHLKQWKFSETFLGRELAQKTLDEFVSSVVSCCGPDSFVTPGPTAVIEHAGKDCKLGLNFTMFFLNEKFKQHLVYCAHYGSQIRPPAVAFSQCEADINFIDQYLSRAQNGISDEARICLFMVINTTSNGVSLSAVESTIELQEQCPSTLQLYQEMDKFERVKSVRCKSSNSSCHSPIGMGLPLVYVSGTENHSIQLIGVSTGNGRALILSSLFQLLKGIIA